MKARSKPLIAPTLPSSRFWTAEVEGFATHWFKHPYYGVGNAVTSAMIAYKDTVPTESGTLELEQARAVAMLPVAGLLIGACWHHLELELETKFPLSDLSPASLIAYGTSIAEELQDAEYDILAMLGLFAAIAPEMSKRQSVVVQASERAAFSEALKVESTPS